MCNKPNATELYAIQVGVARRADVQGSTLHLFAPKKSLEHSTDPATQRLASVSAEAVQFSSPAVNSAGPGVCVYANAW